jgi:competence protein ComEA
MKTTISIIFACAVFFASFVAMAVPVNVNSADTELIADSLAGIGIKTAQKIVDYRKKYGAFKSVNDLLNVSGIGEKKLAKIRADIRLSENKKAKKG